MDRNRRSVMTLTKVMKLPGFALLMVVFWIGAERAVRPQFGPLLDPAYAPQAKSEEELDQYLKIMTDRPAGDGGRCTTVRHAVSKLRTAWTCVPVSDDGLSPTTRSEPCGRGRKEGTQASAE